MALNKITVSLQVNSPDGCRVVWMLSGGAVSLLANIRFRWILFIPFGKSRNSTLKHPNMCIKFGTKWSCSPNTSRINLFDIVWRAKLWQYMYSSSKREKRSCILYFVCHMGANCLLRLHNNKLAGPVMDHFWKNSSKCSYFIFFYC